MYVGWFVGPTRYSLRRLPSAAVMASQLRLSVLNIYYRYDPITDSDTSRLLVLEPGQGKDPLVGKLATLDLRQPVAYEAVSYTWGNESTQDQITLESKRLDLTPSLGTALRRLRLRDRQRVIWVDQISINQKDTVERSNQVGLMNGIYRKATKVLVWLGEGPDGHGAKALRFMKSLDAIFKDELLNELFRQQGEQLDWFPEEHWAALRKLLQNPWVRNSQDFFLPGLPNPATARGLVRRRAHISFSFHGFGYPRRSGPRPRRRCSLGTSPSIGSSCIP